MASNWRADKRGEWEDRLARFRASGMTVVGFCRREKVSVNTFYYWVKRLGSPGRNAISERDSDADGLLDGGGNQRAGAAEGAAVVRFRFASGVEVLVPAGCLKTIRRLVQWTRQSGSPAFQEVRVRG